MGGDVSPHVLAVAGAIRSSTRRDTWREEAEAIRAGRMLLGTPDPVPPPRDNAVSLFRGALTHKVEGYNDARDRGLAKLEAPERMPLDSWVGRIGALPHRFAKVRMAAGKLLEPKVAAVSGSL